MKPQWIYLGLILFLLISTVCSKSRRNKKRRKNKNKHKAPVDEKSAAGIIANIFQNYEQRNAPSFKHATEVQLGLYVIDFFSISERRMDYQLSIYLRQAWKDERLAYKNLSTDINKIVLDEESVDSLWVPDTFIRNEKKADYHIVTVPNQMITVNSTGHVWWVKKITGTMSCPMNLKNYPMDTQRCPMMFESFGYTADTMYFKWLPEAVQISEKVKLPQYRLVRTEESDCSQNYTAGLFPCLKTVFVLKRALGFFLIQIYTPCILIVILSWVGFWINPAAVPARVTLGLVTVLTMTTQLTGANASMPKVSYVKAMDIWLSTCLLFVFASLIEYAFVNMLMRKPPPKPKEVTSLQGDNPELRREEQPSRLASLCPSLFATNQNRNKEVVVTLMQAETKVEVTPVTGPQQANHVEEVSRRIFPAAYVIFCAVYWAAYMYTSNSGEGGE